MRVLAILEGKKKKIQDSLLPQNKQEPTQHTHCLLNVAPCQDVWIWHAFAHAAALGHEPDVEGDGGDARNDVAQNTHLRENPHNLFAYRGREGFCECLSIYSMCLSVYGLVCVKCGLLMC